MWLVIYIYMHTYNCIIYIHNILRYIYIWWMYTGICMHEQAKRHPKRQWTLKAPHPNATGPSMNVIHCTSEGVSLHGLTYRMIAVLAQAPRGGTVTEWNLADTGSALGLVRAGHGWIHRNDESPVIKSAMENPLCIDDVPTRTSIYRGSPIAAFDYWRI